LNPILNRLELREQYSDENFSLMNHVGIDILFCLNGNCFKFLEDIGNI